MFVGRVANIVVTFEGVSDLDGSAQATSRVAGEATADKLLQFTPLDFRRRCDVHPLDRGPTIPAFTDGPSKT